MSSTDSDSRQRKGSRKQRSLFPLAVFFLILLFIASGVLIYLIRGHVEASTGISDTASFEQMSSGFTCEYSEAQKLYPFAQGVLKVTSTRVTYVSMNGTEIYGYDVEMDNPFCVVNGKYALVADNGGFFGALFDAEGLLYLHQMSGAVNFGSVASNGTCAYILEQTDTKGSVYLLDANDTFISEWRSVESGYPISASFSPDASVVNIALADTDGSVVQPHLKQIKIILKDNLYTAEDLSLYTPKSSEILSSIVTVNQDDAYMAGISQVFHVSGGTITESSKPFGQIYSVISAGDQLAVFYSEGVGQEIRLEILASTLARGTPITIGNSFIDAKWSDGRIIVASDKQIIIISANQIERTIDVNKEIIRLGIKEDGALVVVTEDGVREIIL